MNNILAEISSMEDWQAAKRIEVYLMAASQHGLSKKQISLLEKIKSELRDNSYQKQRGRYSLVKTTPQIIEFVMSGKADKELKEFMNYMKDKS